MATIYDVAKSANVSPKTVSRVLNADAPVGEKTRAAVQKAIAELGYVPSSAARTMRSNRSGLIGLVTGAISLSPERPALSGLPDLFIVQGVQKAVEASGRTLLISDTGGTSERVPQLIRTFIEHRVEGIIYVADYHQRIELPELAGRARIVLANCYDDTGSPAILPDDQAGQRNLVRAIITNGHRRIGYLTLSKALDATALRVRGYRAALEEAGIQYDPELVIAADIDHVDPDAEARRLWEAIDRVLSLTEPPTALCFGNDRMALRAYGMLRSRGLELPADISVAGFDDHRAIAESLFPTLTTAELPYMRMGRRAADLLLALVENDSSQSPEPDLVQGEVVWRHSVQSLGGQKTDISSNRRKQA